MHIYTHIYIYIYIYTYIYIYRAVKYLRNKLLGFYKGIWAVYYGGKPYICMHIYVCVCIYDIRMYI